MAAQKSNRGLVWSVVIFSVLAIVLQGVGLMTPGWIIYNTYATDVELMPVMFQKIFWVEKDQPQAMPFGRDYIDPEKDFDSSSSEEDTDDDGVMHKPGHHHRTPHHHEKPPHRPGQRGGPIPPSAVVGEADVEVDEVTEIKYKASAHIGLWYAKGCIHFEDGKKDDGDSGEKHHGSSEKKKDKKHCNCKVLKPEDAIEAVLNDPQHSKKPESKGKHHHRFTEFKVEIAGGFVFAMLGLISAVVALKRQARITSFLAAVMMLISCLLVFVPVLKLGMAYREMKHDMAMVDELQDDDVVIVEKATYHLRCPYSAFLSAAGMFSALIVSFILSISTCIKSRRERPGRWLQFYNEKGASDLGFANGDYKKTVPELTLHFGEEEAEALPEKVPIE